MRRSPETDNENPQETALLTAIAAWQAGTIPRESLVAQFTGISREEGQLIQQVITSLIQHAPASAEAKSPDRSTNEWRAELMDSRARAWAHPASAGLLVGPEVLILTDGRQGISLRPTRVWVLNSSVSASLLLLCQTIVMADHALNAQELGKLRQQRIESTSSSLSEIEPLP
ncbi:hypothetical protein Dcar01_02707 [Deinococcus carri]|uniref:Uncharacterized protein n=1 Tax=Deinococcus carri TaxID=1211323 RepID=A0ABP9W9D8_9DEIO